MCFCKTRQSKVLRAKRDIVVYKIGAYADKYTFVPYYVNNYTYKTGIQCQTCPDFEEGPESNWNKALNSIVTSVNKESNEDKD